MAQRSTNTRCALPATISWKNAPRAETRGHRVVSDAEPTRCAGECPFQLKRGKSTVSQTSPRPRAIGADSCGLARQAWAEQPPEIEPLHPKVARHRQLVANRPSESDSRRLHQPTTRRHTPATRVSGREETMRCCWSSEFPSICSRREPPSLRSDRRAGERASLPLLA
jgi:hypothetical protein